MKNVYEDAVMNKEIIIPAQVRAARALLEWSQEQLADEAEVGLSTVREVESQRRPLDTAAAREICRALQNAGVIFVPGGDTEGPGVRFVAGRPHVIRLPTVMTMWDGLPFVVEWKGNAITVFIAREAMDDLGRFRKLQPDAAYLKVFEKYRGSILDGVTAALAAGRTNAEGRLRLGGEDISALA
jgi:transcriptional regulator with XRE-family HTH domain